ncbi:hypothetical protein BDZ91DRAFT_772200 [Kalaharituber pfeilii]|nr:hypothetical protein BDZ91DRAFT_772200 [Kalaharituber pfeilii]
MLCVRFLLYLQQAYLGVPSTASSNLVTIPSVTIYFLAKTIDHCLLHPTLTDAAILSGLDLSIKHNVATACVKPSSVPFAVSHLGAAQSAAQHTVKICPVVGFPHGTSLTSTKLAEAGLLLAITGPGAEFDMVVNVGKIRQLNELITVNSCTLKVIFENDYLHAQLPASDCADAITRLCTICCDAGVAFTNTSTGYGFVKDPKTGAYGYVGARMGDLRRMVEECSPRGVQVKAAGGVRTLDDLLKVIAIGVTRVILEEVRRRGIPEGPEGGVEVVVDLSLVELVPSAYEFLMYYLA